MKKLVCLTLSLLLMLVCVCALAATDDVKAVIDGKTQTFDSFDDAIEAANGHTATITLQRIINPRSKVIVTSGDITINMNGNGFYLFNPTVVFEVSGGKLTFSSNGFIVAGTSGFLRIYGGEVSFTGGFGVRNYLSCRSSQIEMSGGTLNITGDMNFDNTTSLYCDIPALAITGGTVNISNGTYKSRQSYETPQTEINKLNSSAISFSSRTKVNLKGGNFYGISAGTTLNNLLESGYQYDLNGTSTKLENSRYNGSLLSVRYLGYPQEPLVVTTNLGSIIRPSEWWNSNNKEQYSISVSGGSGSGKLSATTNTDLPRGYLYVGDFGNYTTATITVGKPETKATPVTIIVTKTGDSYYMSTSATIEVLLAISLVDDCDVPEISFPYDGQWHAPNPRITIERAMVEPPKQDQPAPEGIYEMQEGIDYRLEYTEQSMPGTYTYKVIGLDGILSGEQEFTWTIEPLPFNSDRIQAMFVNPGASTQEAEFIVYDTELETRLYQDMDFETNYIPHSDPGTHTFQIRGIGGYEGSIDMTWNLPGRIEDTEITVTPHADQIDPDVDVMYNQKKLVRWTDYTLDWPEITGPGATTVTVKGIGAWSGEVTKPWPITYTLDDIKYDITIAPCAYTGEPVTPVVTVAGQREGRTLVEGEDYTVSFANNTEIGTATATITGMGYYTGEVTAEFEIRDGDAVMGLYNDEYRYFSSFDEAFDFYFGEESTYSSPIVTITLLSDQTTEGGRMLKSGRLTLELNRHTLTNTSWEAAIYVGTGFDEAYLPKRLTINGPGSFTGSSTLLNVGNEGTLLINGGTLSTDSTAIMATSPTAHVYVVGGTLRAGYSALYLYDAHAVINGGSFHGNPALDINNAGAAIHGGSFTTDNDYKAVSVNEESSVSIYGGTFQSNSTMWGASGLQVGGGSWIRLYGGTFIGNGPLEISGGLMSALAPGKAYLTSDGLPVDFGDETEAFYFFTTEGQRDDYDFVPSVQTITIGKAIYSLADGKFSLSFASENDADFTYTGEPITPAVTITGPDGIVLVEGTDYTATYTNNVNVSDEPAVVTVTGCGDYVGTLTAEFTILPRSLSDAPIMVGKTIYNGAEQKIDLTVICNGKVLVEGTDYTMVMNGTNEPPVQINATDPNGNAPYGVRVTGIGNYTGTFICIWILYPMDVEHAADKLDITVTGLVETEDGFLPVIEVSHADKLLQEGVDYDMTAEASYEYGEHTATLTFKGNYMGTLSVSYIIPKPIGEVEAHASRQTYDGTAQMPIVDLFDGSYLLNLGEDYEFVDVQPQTESGHYTATIRGIGRYKGDAQIEWIIKPLDVTDGTYRLRLATDADLIYTGEKLTPEVILKDIEGNLLTEGVDYTLTYENNVYACVGTDREPARVTATCIGNYTGVLETGWEIRPASLEDGSFTMTLASNANPVFSGEQIIPAVIIEDSHGKQLHEGMDYTLTSENSVNATGEEPATVTAAGIGNYAGELKMEFRIDPAPITDAELISSDDFYTGNVCSPNPILSYKGMRHSPEGNFTYVVTLDGETVEEPIHAGEYELVLKGIGNFTGTASFPWIINSLNVSILTIQPSVQTIGFEETENGFRPLFHVTIEAQTLKDHDLKIEEQHLREQVDYLVGAIPSFEPGMYLARINFCDDYSGWMFVSYTIPKPINDETIEAIITPVVYDGKSHQPEIILKDKEDELVQGVDYEVIDASEHGFTDAGIYNISIQGLGCYTGERTVEFTIEPYDIRLESVWAPDTCYTGRVQYPDTVMDEGALCEGIDYEIEVTCEGEIVEPIHAGEYVIHAKGIGNYCGECSEVWRIYPLEIETPSYALTAELISLEQTENGFLPRYEVKLAAGVLPDERILTEGIDYIVNAKNITFDVGGYSADIVFMGDFEGVMTVYYDNPETIEWIDFDYEPMVYTGTPQTPKFTLKNGWRELVPGEDYELVDELRPQTKVGSYPIKVRGIGEYWGEKTFQWSIRAVNLDKCKLTLSAEETTYPEIPDVTLTYGDIKLVRDTDYAVIAVNTEIGESSMLLQGHGNFEGTLIVRWAMKLDLESMNTLKLPAALKRIESEAFAGTDAQVIVIPATCEYVADDAFNDCEKLQFIVNHSSVTITPPEGVQVIVE